MMAVVQNDIDELGTQLQDYIAERAAQAMPDPVLLTVRDNSTRASNGWVLCDLEARIVRCMVPGNWDTSVGVVLVALPPNDPAGVYWAVGAWGSHGADDSYVPRMIAPSYSVVNSAGALTTVQTTDEKAKVSSNDTTGGYLNGKLLAGSNITLTENNDGANETLTIASTASGGATVLNDLTDVTLSAPGAGHILRHDGTDWKNVLLSAYAILLSLIDAKGDLLVGTANDTAARLAAGSNGQYLEADSSQSGGMKWATSNASLIWLEM